MICDKLDGDLQRLSIRRRCCYTRYADDITFSTSNEKFPKALAYFQHTGENDVILIGRKLQVQVEHFGKVEQ